MVTQRIVFLVLVGLIGSACGPDAKRKAVQSTLISVNAARDGFVAWDAKHQQAIVDSATSFQDGSTKLTEYRNQRSQLEIAFAIAYKTLAAAALDLKEANVVAAIEAATEVYDHVRQLMGESADGLVPKGPEPLVPPSD